jgi:hypothetical protein
MGVGFGSPFATVASEAALAAAKAGLLVPDYHIDSSRPSTEAWFW